MLVLPGMTITMIIGMDMLSENNAKVDIRNKTVTIANKKLKWTGAENKSVVQDDEININFIEECDKEELCEENFQCLELKRNEDQQKKMKEEKDKIMEFLQNNKIKLNCDDEYKDRIIELLQEHDNLINNETQIAKNYEHKLQVTTEDSFNCKTYPVPYRYKEMVWKEINSMLENDIIEYASTNFINPIVVVKK